MYAKMLSLSSTSMQACDHQSRSSLPMLPKGENTAGIVDMAGDAIGCAIEKPPDLHKTDPTLSQQIWHRRLCRCIPLQDMCFTISYQLVVRIEVPGSQRSICLSAVLSIWIRHFLQATVMHAGIEQD